MTAIILPFYCHQAVSFVKQATSSVALATVAAVCNAGSCTRTDNQTET